MDFSHNKKSLLRKAQYLVGFLTVLWVGMTQLKPSSTALLTQSQGFVDRHASVNVRFSATVANSLALSARSNSLGYATKVGKPEDVHFIVRNVGNHAVRFTQSLRVVYRPLGSPSKVAGNLPGSQPQELQQTSTQRVLLHPRPSTKEIVLQKGESTTLSWSYQVVAASAASSDTITLTLSLGHVGSEYPKNRL